MWGAKQLILFSTALLIVLPGCSKEGGGAAGGTGGPVVLMSTSKGDMKIELFEKEAPETVKNFLAYVNDGFYDGTIFHRVMPSFMIQGGGFTEAMQEKPTKPPVKNEATNGLTNDNGTLAMARTDAIHSATSQFFINVKDNDALNHTTQAHGYCVFGRVIEGMDVVREIEQVKTRRRGMHSDVPHEPIIIQSVKVLSEANYETKSES
jgi:peptidyl-prolyl cis-trans isomerase B (cyclophilin B)